MIFINKITLLIFFLKSSTNYQNNTLKITRMVVSSRILKETYAPTQRIKCQLISCIIDVSIIKIDDDNIVCLLSDQ